MFIPLKIESTINGISVDGLLKIVIHCNTLNNLDISNGIILDGQQFQKQLITINVFSFFKYKIQLTRS
jgi:hypothetical protein